MPEKTSAADAAELFEKYFKHVSHRQARTRLLQLSRLIDQFHPAVPLTKVDEYAASADQLAEIDHQIVGLQQEGVTDVSDVLRLMQEVHGVGKELTQKRIWVLSSRPPFSPRA